MLEYEGVFFVSWLIKLVIFQQISYSKFRLRYLVLVPTLLTLIEYYNYDVVFWGEILFLPLITIFLKFKERWNWLQSIFYCFFTLTIFDILSSLSSIYFQFLFRVTEDILDKNIWMDWIPILLTFPVYIIFFKIFRINIKLLSKEVKNDKFSAVIKIFTITMIIYYLSSYILSSLPTLEYAGLLTPIDDIYYKRIVIFTYVSIFLGFLFYIQYIIKENINLEVQKVKDSQIESISKYSNHIESLYREVRNFRHDYTNLLVSLNESIKNRDIDGVERIYNSVLKESDKSFYNSQYDIAKLVNLKNLAMKSVVSAKMIEAQNKGIGISVEIEKLIDIPSSIELIDFLKILSIFLDNALEATIESDAPYISFIYFQEDNQKFLIIENTIRQNKVNTKDIFKYSYSTKGDSRGIGLSNVSGIISENKKVSLKTYSENYRFTQELIFEEKSSRH